MAIGLIPAVYDFLSRVVGSTSDTGGSTTAGSVMGKLNELLTRVKGTAMTSLSVRNSAFAVTTSYQDLVNVTGEGFVNFFYHEHGTSTKNYIKIIVDGTAYYHTWTTTGNHWLMGLPSYTSEGTATSNFASGTQGSCLIQFKDSLQIQVRADTTAHNINVTITGQYRT